MYGAGIGEAIVFLMLAAFVFAVAFLAVLVVWLTGVQPGWWLAYVAGGLVLIVAGFCVGTSLK